MAALFVVVYATIDRSRRTYKEVSEIQDRWHVVRSGLHRMTQDLSMAYVSSNENLNAVARRTYFRFTDGEYGPELRFSSFAHRRLYRDAKESDQCIIQYFLAPDPDDASKTSLFRRETRRLEYREPEEILGEAYVLIDNVLDIRYEFFDKPEDRWREEWDTIAVDGQPNRLPQRVRIYLTIEDEHGRERVLVTQAQPRIMDALSFTPSGVGVPGSKGGGSKRNVNPFSSKWQNLINRRGGGGGGGRGGGGRGR
jgi:general secretion pathway protein J